MYGINLVYVETTHLKKLIPELLKIHIISI